MGFSSWLKQCLVDPRLRTVDYESAELAIVHREILDAKPMMRGVFLDFYRTCLALDAQFFFGTGQRVEIGAGVSLFKTYRPEIVSTDIKPTPSIDMVVDAQSMPFRDASLLAVYGINCFHHFPQPDRFLRELDRVLVSGGGCVLIEPYHGLVARRFYHNLFATETFDMLQPNWSNESAGIMKGANQALSWIVFERDSDILRERHPTLEVVWDKPLDNYVRYILSGGLNFRQLLPGFTAPLLRGVEWLISPLNSLLALHHAVVIRKRRPAHGNPATSAGAS